MTNPLLSMFVFPAPQPSYTMNSFPNELLWMPWIRKDKRSDDGPPNYAKCRLGDCIPAVFLRSPAARYMVIYLHSNGEDIGLAYPFGCGLRMVLEVHVLLVEYPGYGICPGECSEETMWEVAQSALRFATETLGWPLEDVIIMGRSIGAAVAARLACTYACHGLILVAPFLSLVDAVTQYVGALAPMLVSASAFSTKDLIGKVNMPMLVIHGMQDRLISCSHGQTLWEMCPHKKKFLVCPETMSHNTDLLSNADFLIRPMLRFFALPDYSFVDLVVPPEAFDKRHCPQYHKLVETVKSDKPLLRPQGDEEPCPVGVTSAGPSSVFGPCNASTGDDDDLAGSTEFTVRTPPLRCLSPPQLLPAPSSQPPSRENSALFPLQEEPAEEAELCDNGVVPNLGSSGTSPGTLLEELHALNAPETGKLACDPEQGGQDDRHVSHGDSMSASSSSSRKISGPAREHFLPIDLGVETGLADSLPDSQSVDPPKAADETNPGEEGNCTSEGVRSSEVYDAKEDNNSPACALRTTDDKTSGSGSGRSHDQVLPSHDGEKRYIEGTPSSPDKIVDAHVDQGETDALPSDVSNTAAVPSDTQKSPSKLSTRTDSCEGSNCDLLNVPDEQDKDWTMPSVPSDSLPGSDTEWPVHPGIMPTLMYGKPSQQRVKPSSNLATTLFKAASTGNQSGYSSYNVVDQTETSWEEGSTLPPTAELSRNSRRTHEFSDFRTMSEPDCVTAPGLGILNINEGISRFLHEGVTSRDTLEQ
mmetsp:Transcript_68879/g.109265  ORF Transcript_68879/g.109265 Transcript_68879/m.109265 type:complete len:757 (-) Transcript_68879:6-2276(-)